jgi:MFS family permease
MIRGVMDATPSNQPAPTSLENGRAMPGRIRSLARALRHRNYRLFFAGQIVSLCGTFLTQVAMVWLVYSLTGSGRILGFTAFVGQVPSFLLGPFAGVWVDRLNKRKLIVATQILAMTQSFALAALVFFFQAHNNVVVSGLISLAFIQGLINAFDMPGRQAFLVEMVTSREDLANAIALNSTMVHAARLIGPALGGFLIHYVGPTLCFTLDGISYIGVIAALLAMRLRPVAPRRTTTSVWHDLVEGFRYVWHFAPIRSMLILMALLSLTGMPAFSVLMPIFATALSGHRHGAETLGFLMASSASGALAGALYLASRRSVVGLGRVIAIAATIFGLMLIAFSLSHHLWLSMLIAPLAGCAMLINFASANTVLQTLVEDEKRGRVMSFFTMAFVGMTPWGNLLAGNAADWFGPGFVGAARTLQIAGALCVIAAISFTLKLPAIRKVVRPIYAEKGILPPPEVAAGLQTATEVAADGAAGEPPTDLSARQTQSHPL